MLTSVDNVHADEFNIVNFESGIKGKGEKKGLTLTSLKEDSIAQLDTVKITKKKDEVKIEGTFNELKDVKQKLENDISITKSQIDFHEKKIDNKVIQQTATKNEIEEVKNDIQDIKSNSPELVNTKNNTSEIIEAKPVATNYTLTATTSMTTSTTDSYIENKKETIKDKESTLTKLGNEEKSLKVAKNEAESKLKELHSDKDKVDKAIQVKEEEEAKKKAEEEEKARKKAEEEARKIAHANADFNQNAASLTHYSGGTYVTFSEQIKDSDFDVPSVQTTQTGYPGNAYALGQCTWYVYNRVNQTGHSIDPFLGNGADWNDSAIAKGYQVTNKPVAGSAVVFEPGVAGSHSYYGHVAFVEHVYPDGSFLISEMNISGVYTMAWRHLTPSEGMSFVIPS